MVTPAGQNASVVLTFTTRDNASPGIQRIGANLTRLQSTAAGVGKVFAQNSTAFIGAGLALATAGAQVAQLGVKFGLLNAKQGEILGTSLQVAGVFFTMTGALAQVVATATGLGLTMAVLGSTLIAFLPVALAVAVAIAAIVTGLQLLRDPTKPTTLEQLTGIKLGGGAGPGRTRADAFFGLTPPEGAKPLFSGRGKPAFQGGIFGDKQPVVINAGVLVADETGLRELEPRLRNVRGEEQRTRGNTR